MLVLLGLQDGFFSLLALKRRENEITAVQYCCLPSLWKTSPITLLPLMHSTYSTVFLQLVWQRNVLEWSCAKAAVPWGRHRLPLVLARATPPLPAGLLAPCSSTSNLSSLFCVQVFVSTIWFTSWLRSLQEDENYYTPLYCNGIVYFFQYKELACYLPLFPNHPVSLMNSTMVLSLTFLFSCLPLCVSCCVFHMVL